MDYSNTTIKFYVSFYKHGINKSEILDKLKALKEYIKSNAGRYGFKMLVDNNQIIASELENEFNDFINFCDKNIIEVEEELLIENKGSFDALSLPDLEDGELEYSNSFVINGDSDSVSVYVTMESWYASELERLPNANIGISCEMVDIDGDYYEFDI